MDLRLPIAIDSREMRTIHPETERRSSRYRKAPGAATIALLCLLLQGCDDVEVIGPSWVQNDTPVTYTVDMEPQYNYLDSTVYVVAEIPESWNPSSWTYTGVADGSPINGTGLFQAGDSGICAPSMPSLPSGYKRVHMSEGVIPTLVPGRDHATVRLFFNTGSEAGAYGLKFFVHLVHSTDVICDTYNPAEFDVHQWERLEWEQLVGTSSPNSPGLGGRPGLFWSRREFQGHLYTVFDPDIGTYPDGYGAEVWRTADLTNWELVRPAREDEYRGTLVTLGDRLMLITLHDLPAVPDDQYELWSTENGLDWSLLTTWLDWPRVVVDSQQLLAVVLHRGDNFDYDYTLVTSSDGVSWTTVGGGPFAFVSEGVTCGTFWSDDLYLGGVYSDADDELFPRMWRFDGASLEIVETSQLDGDSTVMRSMTGFGDRLVVGTSADLGGEIWSFDGVEQWQQIADHGLGLPGSDSSIRALADRSGWLFALVNRGDKSQIWYANEDFIWSKSDLDDVTAGSDLWTLGATGDELLSSGELTLWRRVLLFEDGFETNDISRWSSAVQ
jgi:hypothetical protein